MFKRNKKTKDRTPLLIVVSNGRYDAYGEPTPRARYLMKVLQKKGGINESVAPGRYHYNVRRINPFQVMISLEHAPDEE